MESQAWTRKQAEGETREIGGEKRREEGGEGGKRDCKATYSLSGSFNSAKIPIVE
jgi:hypothetical protein